MTEQVLAGRSRHSMFADWGSRLFRQPRETPSGGFGGNGCTRRDGGTSAEYGAFSGLRPWRGGGSLS